MKPDKDNWDHAPDGFIGAVAFFCIVGVAAAAVCVIVRWLPAALARV